MNFGAEMMVSGSSANSKFSVSDVIGDLRSSWKDLALASLVFKVISFVVLTPLVGILFRFLISMSGNAVITDVDLIFLFVRPIGWLCLVVTGSLWLAIVALGQAALLGIVCAKKLQQPFGFLDALGFAVVNAWGVLQVTVRIIAFTLLIATPFLAVAAAVYSLMLTQYDINYYLLAKPSEFFVAIGIGIVICVALAAALLKFYTNWFLAIPLVLFEGVPPADALRCSRQRSFGHRRTILVWTLTWIFGTTLLTTIASVFVGLVGHFIIPDSSGSLRVLEVSVGIILMLWVVANFIVNLINTTSFAVIFFNLYLPLAGEKISAVRLGNANERLQRAGFQFTFGRLVGAGVVGVVIALVTGMIAMRSISLKDNVQIMAHRGASDAAPENTMAAFRQAIDDGADWIELDVQETLDGEVVVVHDSDFMKLAANPLKVWDATADDLKSIDIGSNFSADFAGERVPTLGEVLDLCKGKIGVNIELKYYGHEKQLEQRVVDVVESRGMTSEVVAMSLKMGGVRQLKSIRPNWTVGLLMSVSAGKVGEIEADFLAVNAGFANPSFVRAAHASGKEVYVWTVNDAMTMSTMISRGVDGILTDKPALAVEVLNQRAQMGAPERLLLELAGILGAEMKIGDQ